MEISKEELTKLIADAVADSKPAKKKAAAKTKKERTPLTEEEKVERRAKVDALTVAAFKAKGYSDIRPRENVMTFNKWAENGRRVKRGEKSTKCGTWPLFHYDQTEPLVVTKH